MQVDFTLEELELVRDAVDRDMGIYSEEHEDLLHKIDEAIEQAQELESLDLNDCGGACTL